MSRWLGRTSRPRKTFLVCSMEGKDTRLLPCYSSTCLRYIVEALFLNTSACECQLPMGVGSGPEYGRGTITVSLDKVRGLTVVCPVEGSAQVHWAAPIGIAIVYESESPPPAVVLPPVWPQVVYERPIIGLHVLLIRPRRLFVRRIIKRALI